MKAKIKYNSNIVLIERDNAQIDIEAVDDEIVIYDWMKTDSNLEDFDLCGDYELSIDQAELMVFGLNQIIDKAKINKEKINERYKNV